MAPGPPVLVMERQCWVCQAPLASAPSLLSTCSSTASSTTSSTSSSSCASPALTTASSYFSLGSVASPGDQEKLYNHAASAQTSSSQAVSCSSCRTGEKMFCSKAHLLLHRPATVCLPFRIASCAGGRQLVASRAVAAGELLLREPAVLLTPGLTSRRPGEPVCVECHVPVEGDNYTLCGSCGFPLCRGHGREHPTHQAECSLLRTCGVSLSPQERSLALEEHYAALATLRVLLAADGEGGAALLVRAALGEGQLVIGQEGGSASCLMQRVLGSMATGWGKERVDRACNYMQRHAVPTGPDSDTNAVFPLASLLANSCIPNTKSSIHLSDSGPRIEVRATVPLPEGAPLHTARASPLLDMTARRTALRARLTPCACARCCSRTELQSFTSALACLACDNITGFFLPPAADTGETDYTCDFCGGSLPADIAARTTEELRPIVAEYGMFDMEAQEDFLNCLLTKFHQQHSLILQLRTSVACQLGREGEGGLAAAAPPVLQRKVDSCEAVLAVLAIVLPGLTRERGLLLTELADSLLTLSVRQHSKDRDEAAHRARSAGLRARVGEAGRCLEGEAGEEAGEARHRLAGLQTALGL